MSEKGLTKMFKQIKKVILGIIIVFLFYGIASAGMLSGRIVKEDGRPLSKTEVYIQGKRIMTNEFGGYEVELPDGGQNIEVKIGNKSYLSDKIIIYSPKTRQNWRIDTKNKKLIKIR
jgi:hypothetical protein